MKLIDDIRPNLHLLEGQVRKDMTALCDALDGLVEVLNGSEQRKRELIEENRVLREGIAIVHKQGRCGCGGYGYHDNDCAHKKLRETIIAADALRDKENR